MRVMRDVPRAVLRASLWATRLPLSVVESLRGDRAGTWQPMLMFDGFAASVRQFAGGVLHDDELVHAARLERARVAELQRAAELDTVAAATREQADTEAAERHERAKNERAKVAHQTRAHKVALERAQAQKHQRVNANAEARETSLREAEAETKEQLSKQQRATRKARLGAERDVLHDERGAVAARGAAIDAEQELRQTKAARRSTRPDS